MAKIPDGYEVTNIQMPVELADEFRELASANERSLAGEIRFAMRYYLNIVRPK